MLAKDVKRGSVVVHHDQPCIIETVSVQSPSARGASTFYKFRARNLITRQKVDITLRSGDTIDEADFQRRPVQLLYTDAESLHLMDKENYNQFAIAKDDATDEMNYITESLDGILALIYEDRCVAIDIPQTVELKVTQCDPGVRGNSATSRTKPATLETGLIVQVPEYLSEGEIIKVDTRSGAFLSRA